MSDPSPQVIVTLVHGTWGRGMFWIRKFRPNRPRWFETGSAFRTSLIEHLPRPKCAVRFGRLVVGL